MPAPLTPEQIADRMLVEAGLVPLDVGDAAPGDRLFGDIDWTTPQPHKTPPAEPETTELEADAVKATEPLPGQWGPFEPLPIERKPRLLERVRSRDWVLPTTSPGILVALPLAVALAIFIARPPATEVSVRPPAITVVSPPSHASSRAGGERRPAAAIRTATRQSRGTDRSAESAPAAPSKSSGGRVSRLSPTRGSVPPPDADATVEFLP